METFSWLVQVLGTPGAWCSIGLQLMKGLLTFWAILASRQLWEQEAGGGAKKLPLWSPNPPWADGAIWHMVNWPPSKMLLSEISPKLEPLKLSLEICPISTSARSPNCQQKLFIRHNQWEEKKTLLILVHGATGQHMQTVQIICNYEFVLSHQPLCNRPAQKPL